MAIGHFISMMKQNKKKDKTMKTKILFVIALFTVWQNVSAEIIFTAVSPSGHTLYYSIWGSNSVRVICPSSSTYWLYATKPVGDVIIPDSVTYSGTTYVVNGIGNDAFRDCDGLVSLSVPPSVKYIGCGVFTNCTSFATIYYRGDITQWCEINFDCGISTYRLYMGGTELTDLVIPDSIVEIKKNAFANCNSLISVTIPDSVSVIRQGAFYGCNNLTTINFNPTNCTVMGNSNSSVFEGCEVSQLVIGNNVTNIPNNAFRGCMRGLTSLIVPDSVVNIGDYAFYGCNHLTSVSLGANVQNIGNYSFGGCSQVQIATAKSETPATLYGSSSLGFSDNCVLHIPCGSAPDYAMTAFWTRFFPDNYLEDLMYTLTATTSDPAKGIVQILQEPSCDNHEALIEATPYHNYRFSRWDDGNTDNPRYIVVLESLFLTAIFEDENEGVEDVESINAKVYAHNGQIVVENVNGNDVNLYDMNGRIVQAIKPSGNQTICLDVPTSGTYMLKIGDLPARKVVVVR